MTDREKLIQDNPHLTPGGDTSKNMKAHLRKLFPGVAISVRRGRGTGSSWFHASWTDGPTERDVRAVTNQFQSMSFNGMTDGYDATNSTFAEVFGGGCGCNTRCDFSDRVVELAISAVWRKFQGNLRGVAEPTAEDFNKGRLWGMQIPGLNGSPTRDCVQSCVGRYLCGYDATAGRYVGDDPWFVDDGS